MPPFRSSSRAFLVRTATAIFGGLGLSGSAHAQLTHYVPFDAGYVAGADLNGSGGSDLGFGVDGFDEPQTWFDGAAPGAGSTVVAGNLNTPPGLQVAGNSASTAPSDFDLAFYSFNDGLGGVGELGVDNLATGEHWLSFLARAEESAFFGGFSFTKFFGDEILYIGKVGGEGGTEWGVDPQTGGGPVAIAGSDATVDTFLVARLTLGPSSNDDTIDLFLNPTPGGAAPTTPDLSVGFNEIPADASRQIDEIRIGSQNGAFHIDEIRIGATFADVAPGGAPIAADYDLDGDVDADDYDAWAADFGVTTGSDADGNSDGVVDAADYTVWRDTFPFAPPAGAAAVPEPQTVTLAGLSLLAGVRRRQAQR